MIEYTILEFLAYYLWVLYFKTLSILKTLTDVINNPLKYTDSSEYGIASSEYTKDTGAYVVDIVLVVKKVIQILMLMKEMGKTDIELFNL